MIYLTNSTLHHRFGDLIPSSTKKDGVFISNRASRLTKLPSPVIPSGVSEPVEVGSKERHREAEKISEVSMIHQRIECIHGVHVPVKHTLGTAGSL